MAQVRLILRDDIEGLGDAGDVVSVKPGFARNYLLPQGKAILATEGKVRELEHHKRIVAEQVARERTDREAERERIEAIPLEVTAQAGEEGRLYGSVTSARIAELLREKGFEVERRRIQLSEPIKELGDYEVPVKLHRDVVAKIKLSVKPVEE